MTKVSVLVHIYQESRLAVYLSRVVPSVAAAAVMSLAGSGSSSWRSAVEDGGSPSSGVLSGVAVSGLFPLDNGLLASAITLSMLSKGWKVSVGPFGEHLPRMLPFATPG